MTSGCGVSLAWPVHIYLCIACCARGEKVIFRDLFNKIRNNGK
jgi:hypothetical protein